MLALARSIKIYPVVQRKGPKVNAFRSKLGGGNFKCCLPIFGWWDKPGVRFYSPPMDLLVFRSSARQVAYSGLVLLGMSLLLTTVLVYAGGTARTARHAAGLLAAYKFAVSFTLPCLLVLLLMVGSRYSTITADEHTVVLRKPFALFSRTNTWPVSLLASVALKTIRDTFFQVQYRNGEVRNVTVDFLPNEALVAFATFLHRHGIPTTGF